MFRRFNKLAIYILTLTVLTGTWFLPATASDAEEGQPAAAQEIVPLEKEEPAPYEEPSAPPEEPAAPSEEDTGGQEEESPEDQSGEEGNPDNSGQDQSQSDAEENQGQSAEAGEGRTDDSGNGQSGDSGDHQTEYAGEGQTDETAEYSSGRGSDGQSSNAGYGATDGSAEGVTNYEVAAEDPDGRRSDKDRNQFDEEPEIDPTKIDLSGAEVQLETELFRYDANAPHPEVTVTLDGTVLERDIHYVVLYDESPLVGLHTLMIRGIGKYTGSAKREYTIEKREQAVYGPDTIKKRLGDEDFRLNANSNGDGELVYRSNNTKVADVSDDGTVRIKGTGTAMICVFAKESETSNRSGVHRVIVKVLKKKQIITSVSAITKSLGTISFPLNVVSDGNGLLVFSSSNRNVAAVSKAGKVTIKGVGSAKITVYAAETATCLKSSSRSITINVGPEKMTAPDVINSADNKIAVKWDKQAGVSGYQIQYSAKIDFSKSKVVTAGAYAASRPISGLTKDATYYVRIRPYKNQGGHILYAEWSEAAVVMISRGKEKTFEKTPVIKAEANRETRVSRISWDKLEGATGYQVNNKIGEEGNWLVVKTTSGTSYKQKAEHGSYYYQVRAYQENDDGSRIFGEYSAVELLRYYEEPVYTTFLTGEMRSNVDVVSFRIKNSGGEVMRVYSEGARLSNGTSIMSNRDLYIAASDTGEIPYVDILPGETADLSFRSVDDRQLWYNKLTKIYYGFSYDGVKYTAISSDKAGTDYMADESAGVVNELLASGISEEQKEGRLRFREILLFKK